MTLDAMGVCLFNVVGCDATYCIRLHAQRITYFPALAGEKRTTLHRLYTQYSAGLRLFTQGLHAFVSQCIGPLVARVARMALDPAPVDLVATRADDGIQPLP
jgi:hypothetical protein